MNRSYTRLIGFDAVRGLAALLVFLYHFGILRGVGDVSKVPLVFSVPFFAGHVGLDIFFVLSGYLLYRSVALHGASLSYVVRRFLRIAPIYYVSLLVCVLFLEPALLASVEGRWNITSHLLFIQSFDPTTYYGINPVLWSLSIEMLFYIFLPFFVLLTRRNNVAVLLGCLVMIFLSLWYRDWITQFYPFLEYRDRLIFTENFVGRLDQFAFGILAALVGMRLRLRPIVSWIATILFFLGLYGLYWGMVLFTVHQADFRDVIGLQLMLHTFLALSAASVLFGLERTWRWFAYLIAFPPLTGIGVISYSFYIWHYIVIERITSLGFNVRITFILALSFSLMLSTITYFLIERPFLQKKWSMGKGKEEGKRL